MWQLITFLFAYNGVRRGEALGIEWSDIDFDNRIITLRHNLQMHNGALYTNPLKNKRIRIIYLNNDTISILKEYRNELIDAVGENQLPQYVFHNIQTNRRLKPNETSDYYKAFGKKCGLKINPHKFRHTVGTLLADEGLSAIEISEILGDGVEVTTRHYINDSAIRVKNATNKMFELINEDTV